MSKRHKSGKRPGAADKARDEPLARPIEDCVQLVFPTPIALHVWPDSQGLNAALKQAILAEEAKSPGLDRSNVGGWHSPMDFLLRPQPPQQRLMGRIRSMVGAMTDAVMKPGRYSFKVEGWANVLRKGQYNSIHQHPNSTWSGVYYVTGNPPPAEGEGTEYSGKIEFIDPRPGASATYSIENTMQRRSLISPDPGGMIVFPSWMQHLVHPYFGPEERISIAFNVLVS